MNDLARLLAGAICGAALTALVWAAATETYLRLIIPSSSGGSIYRYTPETRRYKVLKPSASVVAWGAELKTNNLGFRDDAPSIPPKQPGEFRVVVLGSSFTLAAGVDFRDTYTARLERLLRRRHARTEVLNLAVGGYNTVQQELMLEEVGLSLAPDLVLVALFPSGDFSMDLYEESRRIALGEAKPSAPDAWYDDSYVYRAYFRKFVDKATGLLHRASGGAGGSHRGWDEGTAALRRIAALARERGLPLAVAVLPHTFGLPAQRGEFSRVESFCRDARLFCVNLLEPFIRRHEHEAELRLHLLDSHPSARYHAVVAEVLAGALAPMLPAAQRAATDRF